MDKRKEIIWGIHSLEEALNKNINLFKILINKTLNTPSIRAIVSEARKKGIPIQYLPIEKLNRIVRKNHQGIIGYVSPVAFYNIEDLVPTFFEKGIIPTVLLLDGVSDVRNLGAIIRSAVCMNVQAIVVPDKGSAQIGNDAVKTSAGAIFKIPICRTPNLSNTIKYLKNSGFTTFAATEKGTTLLPQADFSSPTTIIMGDEGKGISNNLLKHTDFWIKIPMTPDFDSLNVSVATGIILYENYKQKSNPIP